MEEDATSPSLNTHMVVHFGEKPHKCTQCNKSFNVASSLKTHMLVHSRETPPVHTVCQDISCNIKSPD